MTNDRRLKAGIQEVDFDQRQGALDSPVKPENDGAWDGFPNDQ
jgi:hypothetical protein